MQTRATSATDAVSTAKLQDASVTAPKLAPGAAAASLATQGLGAVPSGAILLSERAVNPAFTAAGFEPTGVELPLHTEQWSAVPAGPPANGSLSSARHDHTAVWMGTEMLVIGGKPDNQPLRYNPAANSWSVVNKVGAPAIGDTVQAFWNGTQVIVWDAYHRVGGRYNPATDTWQGLSESGAPSARQFEAATLVNGYLIVWGGRDAASGQRLNTGGRYDPASDHRVLIWGGHNGSVHLDDGALLDPFAGTWTTMSTTGAPAARMQHGAVWLGNEMFILNGNNGANEFGENANDNRAYRPKKSYYYRKP